MKRYTLINYSVCAERKEATEKEEGGKEGGEGFCGEESSAELRLAVASRE